MDNSELQLRKLFAPSREDSEESAALEATTNALFFPQHQHQQCHADTSTVPPTSAFRYSHSSLLPAPAAGAVDAGFEMENHAMGHFARTYAPSLVGMPAMLDLSAFAYAPPQRSESELQQPRGHTPRFAAETMVLRSRDAYSRSHPHGDEKTSFPTAAAAPTLPPRREAAPSVIPLLAEKRRAITLDANMRWISAKEASKAVNDFALFVQKKRARMDKKTSGGRNKKYVCSCAACGWFVRLIKVAKSDNWKISSMQLTHSPDCTGEAQPSARQLAELNTLRNQVAAAGANSYDAYSARVATEQPDFSVEGESLGVKIPVRLAYRAKKILQENSSNMSTSIEALVNGVLGLPGRDLQEKIAESYKLLPSLLQKFSELNPGSVVRLRKDEKGRFKSVFVLPAPLPDLLTSLQRVYGLEIVQCGSSNDSALDGAADSMPPTPRYSGHFVAFLGKDGNLEHRVIAFGLVPVPDIENMSWFLRSLTNAGFQPGNAPVFLACHQLGALAATRREIPLAIPMICTDSFVAAIDQHLAVPTQSFKFIERQIRLASLVDSEEAFRSHLSSIGQHFPAVANYLLSFDPSMWAAYASRSVKKYQWVSTGFREYMRDDVQIAIKTTRLLAGKTSPGGQTSRENGSYDVQHIKSIRLSDFETMVPLEIIYQFLLRHLHIETHRATAAEADTGGIITGTGDNVQEQLRLTPEAEKVFRQELVESDFVDVHMSVEDEAVAIVSSKLDVIRVHMGKSQCSCPTMQQLGIPCRHLLAVARTFSSNQSIRTKCDRIYTAAIYHRGLQFRSQLEDRIPALSGLNRDSSIYPAPTNNDASSGRSEDSAWQSGGDDHWTGSKSGVGVETSEAAASGFARAHVPAPQSPFSRDARPLGAIYARSDGGESSGSDDGRAVEVRGGYQWIV